MITISRSLFACLEIVIMTVNSYYYGYYNYELTWNMVVKGDQVVTCIEIE